MYFVSLIKNIFKPNNIPVLLYFLANVAVSFLLMFWLNLINFGENILVEQSKIYNGLVGLAIYFGGVVLFLSPIGEAWFRFMQRLKPLERFDNLGYVQTIFDEVYQKAEAEHPGLPKGIRLYISKTPTKNAAAIGRKTIFLTEGILALPPDQLKGVLAHELAHLYHGDTTILLLILVGNIFINAIAMMFKMVLWIIGIFTLFGDESYWARIAGYLMTVLMRWIIDGIVALWSVLGLMLKNVSGKKAEYAADMFAHDLGYAQNLAQALASISAESELKYSPSLLERALASHPSTQERIYRLRSGGVPSGN